MVSDERIIFLISVAQFFLLCHDRIGFKKYTGEKKKMEEFKKDLLKVCGKNTAALIIFFVLGGVSLPSVF